MLIRSWKNATIWGILLWIMIFVEVSILMFLPLLQGKEGWQSVIHLVILPFLVLFCIYMYSKGGYTNVHEGFLLGVYFLIIGTVLDLAITIPLFVKSFTFYTQWELWLGFLEVIAFSSLSGMCFSKK
jgi:hypothetical protein